MWQQCQRSRQGRGVQDPCPSLVLAALISSQQAVGLLRHDVLGDPAWLFPTLSSTAGEGFGEGLVPISPNTEARPTFPWLLRSSPWSSLEVGVMVAFSRRREFYQE